MSEDQVSSSRFLTRDCVAAVLEALRKDAQQRDRFLSGMLQVTSEGVDPILTAMNKGALGLLVSKVAPLHEGGLLQLVDREEAQILYDVTSSRIYGDLTTPLAQRELLSPIRDWVAALYPEVTENRYVLKRFPDSREDRRDPGLQP
jgi:hypothetical protein